MEKLFDKWNEDKKKLNKLNSRVFLNEREVWWCSLGVNIGYEADGKNDKFIRPVLILKIFGNGTCWILPLTTKYKEGPYYKECFIGSATTKSYIVLSQLRLISKKRIIKKMGMISKEDFIKVREEIFNILGK
ncbi:MAG: type II toxin-antitoxin system PemK/MazF family toxin [Candidatus Pacebacteria bacterium]|nr:type II toxin-antitoxin system PemK/MazF family toxin [Candidatus Paceibacterota bacterium]